MEDAKDFSFNLIFTSNSKEVLAIKKIVLSFTKNPNSSFISSPGKIEITQNDVKANKESQLGDKEFSLTGKKSEIISLKNILVSDKPVTTNITVKNIGDTTTRIYLGFAIYSKDGKLSPCNYPYKNVNKILNIVSAQKGCDKIIVDSMPEWEQKSYIAFNAKEDLSDIPSFTLLKERVLDIKELDNGKAEITLEKALSEDLNNSENIRIHASSTSNIIYINEINQRMLRPGEELIFESKIQKDENTLSFSSRTALPKGVYYIVPFVYSYPQNANDDSMILIRNYAISY
jgi:hypothetical protein